MAIRNSVFRFVNKYINFRTEKEIGFLVNGNGEQLSERLAKSFERKELAQKQVNLDNYYASQQKTEFEKQKFEILAKYNSQGKNDPRVNPDDVLAQFDRVQILQNLRMIEENESAFDPEKIRFEKLKARVLLEEPGAAQEYFEYVKERPYVTVYEKWTNQNERQMHQYLS